MNKYENQKFSVYAVEPIWCDFQMKNTVHYKICWTTFCIQFRKIGVKQIPGSWKPVIGFSFIGLVEL